MIGRERFDRGDAGRHERCPECGSSFVSDQSRLADRYCADCYHHWSLPVGDEIEAEGVRA